jgi:proline iminopeptidase
MDTVAVNGAELATYSIGQGPPVVVVHGGPGLGHAYLRPSLDRLSEGSS